MSQVPHERSGLTLGATRELLLPAMVVGGFSLYYFGEQPMWVVLLCAAPVLVLYALAPLWAARSVAAFDRDCARVLAARNPLRLRARYARAVGMRLFATPGQLSARKALVLLESGAFRAAQSEFREALDELGPRAPDSVVLGAAHASFAAGDFASAITLYRRVLKGVGAMPGVERKLGLALVRNDEDLATAVEILERTLHEVGAGAARKEHVLTCALAYAKLGDVSRAQGWLDRALEEAGDDSETSKDLRLEVVDRIAEANKRNARGVR